MRAGLPPSKNPLSRRDDPELARVESRQLPVFGRDARAISHDSALSWTDVLRLRDDGMLSFDPERTTALDEAHEAELVFLGTLVRGCRGAVAMRTLLAGLRAPFCYDVRRLYYDWADARWRLLPGDDDPEGVFFQLLARLEARNDSETLLALREWIEQAFDLAKDRRHAFSHESLFPEGTSEGGKAGKA